MNDFLHWLLPAGFMPHGHCYLWRPDVLWLNVASDALIAGAYYAIPLAIAFITRRRGAILPYRWMAALFAIFILLCGTTHLLGIWTVWHPDYVVDGLVKLATGIASVATAALVVWVMPELLALRTPLELQQEVDLRTRVYAETNTRLRDEIVARERSETALRNSEGRYRAAFENAAVGMAHVAPDGRWLLVNQRLCELLGYPREELLGLGFGDITHPEDLSADWAEVRTLLAGHAAHYEIEKRYVRKDGGIVWAHLSVAPVRDHDGAPDYFIAIVTDISARRQAESDLLASRRELEHAVTALQAADQRKDEFLATLAHELRNPMAPIRYAVALLRPDCDPVQLGRAREMIERQSALMARLLDDLLDVSRITRNVITLRRERTELRALARDALEVARASEEGQQRLFTLELPEEDLYADADPARLTQVLGNLLSNAIKHTQAGGNIRVQLRRDGADVRIEVSDDGTGIAPEMLPRIFDLFTQVHPELKVTKGGLGIGLAVVKRLVELHGGRVEVHSDGPGRGAHFSVRMPLGAGVGAASGAAEHTSPAAPVARAAHTVGRPHRH